MKKSFILIAALLMFAAGANAQISTGEPTAHVIRTGNRAQAGNFGIFVGGALDFQRYLDDAEVDYKTLPLINVKYMMDDETELRFGFEWWRKSDKDEADGTTIKSNEGQFGIIPGYAHHFSKNNLLDVYVGGEVPIVFGSTKSEFDGTTSKSKYTQFGVNAFIGLQAYIANLPLALGLEYGIGINHKGVKDGTLTEDGRTIQEYSKGNNQSRNTIGNQVRLTLTYYFN